MKDDDEGHGAAILSLRSHVKLKPDELSYTISTGRLPSKHPTFGCKNLSVFSNELLEVPPLNLHEKKKHITLK